MDEIDFDDLCELAARAARAPGAVITQLLKGKNTLEILGRYGTTRIHSPNTPFPMLDPVTMPFIAIPDISKEQAFADHPITTFSPRVRGLIAVILKSRGIGDRITLTILNPHQDTFDDWEAFACVSKLTTVFRQLLNGLEATEIAAAQALQLLPANSGLQENVAPADGPTAKFLLESLLHKRSLHSRKSASFVTLRAWRQSIKEHQITALAALKQNPPPAFVSAAADEIAAAAQHLYGSDIIRTVVPVPGGSSGVETSFSELLAQEVARKLNCQCIRALATEQVEKGASHPKKSSRLKPYRVVVPIAGTILIVDDVVTSGRHLELAQEALRNAGATCFAIAWIGT